jgi:hypothetical protein
MRALATVRVSRRTWQARRVSPVRVKLPRIWPVGHSIGRAESANENTWNGKLDLRPLTLFIPFLPPKQRRSRKRCKS